MSVGLPVVAMAETAESDERVEEFVLDADSELRFEIETKNEKVTVEVSEVVMKFNKSFCSF